MTFRKLVIFIFLLLSSTRGFSQTADTNKSLSGMVLDIQSKEPIIGATILVETDKYVTKTDVNGNFKLSQVHLKLKTNRTKFTCVGYEPKFVDLTRVDTVVKILMVRNVQALQEVTVKKSRYKNKNNPAVELIEKVIANKKLNRKESVDYYSYNKYDKIQFAINHVTPEFQNKKIFKKFQFIFENIDSLKKSGDKILPVYLKEELSDFYYQRSPHREKEIIRAKKAVSFAGFDNKGIEDNIKYLYQNIDVYDNNVMLVSNQFLSPIASTAPSFYRYYIMDTIPTGGEKCIRMFFGARNKEDLLFQGFLYITTDGQYAVRRVELTTSKNININFISDIKIVQDFDKVDNKFRMLTSDQISMNFAIKKNGRGIFGQKIATYNKHNFTQPSNDTIFKGPKIQILENAMSRDSSFWKLNRHEQLSVSEAKTYTTMDSLQKVSLFKQIMNLAILFVSGYEDLGSFEIGPISTFYMYNPVEGVRFRLGGRTTPKFSNKISLETYAAYGLTDERFKYYGGITWSLTKRNVFEFPVKSMKISYQNETQLPGQEMKFLMEDNFLLSVKRGVNDKMFYNKTFKLEHLNEFQNHFSYLVGYRYMNMSPGGTLVFNHTNYASGINDVKNLNVSEFYFTLRYAPHESFYQGKTFRIPYYSRFPIIELRYTVGNKALGNDYNYQSLKLNVHKRFYLSVLGYSDVVWEAGKIFGKVPYPLLNMPQANQTYSYQIESYNMMNFLEFVTDQYTSLLIDHSFNGFFFNKIPIIRKLGLREVVTCKMLYGNITSQNDPAKHPELFCLPTKPDGTPLTFTLAKEPYIEGSVGIGNIFKIFRVDLVRRFTYLHNPNVPIWGLRMRFRLDF